MDRRKFMSRVAVAVGLTSLVTPGTIEATTPVAAPVRQLVGMEWHSVSAFEPWNILAVQRNGRTDAELKEAVKKHIQDCFK